MKSTNVRIIVTWAALAVARDLGAAEDGATASYNRGVRLERAGRHEEAVLAYREAIGKRPQFSALLLQGRSTDAVTVLARAVESDPWAAEAHYNLGIAQGRLGRWDEAVASYRASLRTRQDLAEAWDGLGIALAKLGRYEEALPLFDEAIRLRPSYSEARFNRALSFAALHRTAEVAR